MTADGETFAWDPRPGEAPDPRPDPRPALTARVRTSSLSTLIALASKESNHG